MYSWFTRNRVLFTVNISLTNHDCIWIRTYYFLHLPSRRCPAQISIMHTPGTTRHWYCTDAQFYVKCAQYLPCLVTLTTALLRSAVVAAWLVYRYCQDRFADFVVKVMNSAATGHTLQTLKVRSS